MIHVEVVESDETARGLLESAAHAVLDCLSLSDTSLLCFFDDQEWQWLKQQSGSDNRGVYMDNPKCRELSEVPERLADLLVYGPCEFEHLIYLHGSTCSTQAGLTLTFAHELQHLIQHTYSTPQVWAENRLATLVIGNYLTTAEIEAADLIWSDIPIEREANLVSKRIAERLLGMEVVRRYINTRIDAAPVDPNDDWNRLRDSKNWQWLREADASLGYDVPEATKLFFPRLEKYRAHLLRALQDVCDDADFRSIQLDINGLLQGA